MIAVFSLIGFAFGGLVASYAWSAAWRAETAEVKRLRASLDAVSAREDYAWEMVDRLVIECTCDVGSAAREAAQR